MLAFKILKLYGGGEGLQKALPCIYGFSPMLMGKAKIGEEKKNPKVLNQKLEIVKMLGFCAN